MTFVPSSSTINTQSVPLQKLVRARVCMCVCVCVEGCGCVSETELRTK